MDDFWAAFVPQLLASLVAAGVGVFAVWWGFHLQQRAGKKDAVRAASLNLMRELWRSAEMIDRAGPMRLDPDPVTEAAVNELVALETNEFSVMVHEIYAAIGATPDKSYRLRQLARLILASLNVKDSKKLMAHAQFDLEDAKRHRAGSTETPVPSSKSNTHP